MKRRSARDEHPTRRHPWLPLRHPRRHHPHHLPHRRHPRSSHRRCAHATHHPRTHTTHTARARRAARPRNLTDGAKHKLLRWHPRPRRRRDHLLRHIIILIITRRWHTARAWPRSAHCSLPNARARESIQRSRASAAKNLDAYRIDRNAHARGSTDASRCDEKKAVNYRVRVQYAIC